MRWVVATAAGVAALGAGALWLAAGRPLVTLRNASPATITGLEIRSGSDTSYVVGELAAGDSRDTPIGGGDKLIWIVGRSATGEALESERVYVTSGVSVAGAYDGKKITLEYRR